MICLGQPQVQGPKQGWESSEPQLFCIPPTAGDQLQEPLFLTALLFKTLPLLCAFSALHFSPKDLLSPKSFLRGYLKYSGTHWGWMCHGKRTLILAVFKQNPQLIFRAWVKACWTSWKDSINFSNFDCFLIVWFMPSGMSWIFSCLLLTFMATWIAELGLVCSILRLINSGARCLILLWKFFLVT